MWYFRKFTFIGQLPNRQVYFKRVCKKRRRWFKPMQLVNRYVTNTFLCCEDCHSLMSWTVGLGGYCHICAHNGL